MDTCVQKKSLWMISLQRLHVLNLYLMYIDLSQNGLVIDNIYATGSQIIN